MDLYCKILSKLVNYIKANKKMEQLEPHNITNMRFLSSIQVRDAANIINERKESIPLEIPLLDVNSMNFIDSKKLLNPLYDKNFAESPDQPTVYKPRSKSASRKESLKFCRGLCKLIVSLLGRESFSTKVFSYFEDLMAGFLGHLDGRFKDRERFNTLSKLVFHKIWKKHRQLLACSHNNKICLVTQDEWDSFFASGGFAKEVAESSEQYKEILDLVQFKDEISPDIFKHLFNKTMFVLNVVFINTIIYCELIKDDKFLKRVPNYETFALMVVEPWLCKHYNHAKEKFALECCNKCKICRSGLIPPDFLVRLKQAREKHQAVKEFYQNIGPLNIYDITKEQVGELFFFWGSQYAI